MDTQPQGGSSSFNDTIDAFNAHGCTSLQAEPSPLLAASIKGYHDVVEILIGAGATVEPSGGAFDQGTVDNRLQ